MHALAQPVSSITATSTENQIAQAKEMNTPVKFRGGKRLGSKSMGKWRRYSDATTIKDALQAGGTPSDSLGANGGDFWGDFWILW